MRLPLQWLADYVEVSLPTRELATLLTMINLKVERIDRVGADWEDVVIGQVVELEPHPASRNPLTVTRVNLGNRIDTIVTGARNVRLGDKVPVFPVGSVVPHGSEGEPFVIQPRPMAGIVSHGMLASASELGIPGDSSGILILPESAPVGAPLQRLLGEEILELETQPNRPDTLAMIGVAREVAAHTQQQLTLPDLDAISGEVTFLDEPSVAVTVEAPDLAPRYSAIRVDGVRVQPSPFWLVRRLENAGMRSINLIVDLTNYVMLEYGQPLHAFDARDIAGGRIIVRRAGPGEQLTTLDGVSRILTPEMLVIADTERAIGLAGVMGGENSEIAPDTTSVILESATFNPVNIRQTARALGLRSEASARFERGLSPETAPMAARRFVQLLAQITGEPLQVARLTDVWAGPLAPRVVRLPMSEARRLLGIEVSAERAAEVLSLLGFDVEVEGETIAASVPFWRRVDIEIPEDLIEEVARSIGYQHIPATLPRQTVSPPAPAPEQHWDRVIRTRLLALGLSEVVAPRLTSERMLARLIAANRRVEHGPAEWEALVPNAAGVYAHEALVEPVTLANPPTADRSILPLTLVPGLLSIVAQNLKHTDEHVAIFEVTRTFFRRPEDLPYERPTLAIVLSGTRRPVTWLQSSPGPFGFYDIKGMVTALLDTLHVSGWSVEPVRHPALHPGRAAALQLRGHRVAFFGELHPLVAERFAIEGWPVQVAEIDLDALMAAASTERIFEPLPRYPAARRDIAVIVGQEVPAATLERVVHEAAGQVLEQARIFDVYTGEHVPEGTKSVAIGMDFRAPGATLRQDEIAALVEAIVAALQRETGASLRA